MKPLISLVIPVYNVERFIPKCMETVLAQTYENYEVILVDDGSTDGSSKLCDEYARSDSRVMVFHKTNGGLADARNYGVRKANADLISFIDSDDFVSEDYLEYLYDLMVKYDADMACAGSILVYNDDFPKNCNIVPSEELLNPEKALERICYTSVGADTRLYKKELLLKYPYPVGRLYEDLATTYKIVGGCETIAFSDRILCFWVQRTGSIMHSDFSEKQYDIFWAAENQLQYIAEKYPRVLVAAKMRYAMASITLLNIIFSQVIDDEKGHFKRIQNHIKPYIWTIIIKSKANLSIKISCLAIWLGYLPSKVLWQIKKKIKNIMGRKTI